MKPAFFTHNRAQLADVLQDGLVVLAAYDKMQQTNDAAAPFVQEANFWYLTGIDMPGWQLVLDCRTQRATLVRPQLSETEKLFESWLSDDEALRLSAADAVIGSDELPELLESESVSYHALAPVSYADIHCQPNPAIGRVWRQLKKQQKEVNDVRLSLAKLRAIKQPEEIAAMRRAIHLTVDAFEIVKRELRGYGNEREVAARFTYEFMRWGGTHAYEPIVASGKNACTLHYAANNHPLSGLILIDVGARIGGYTADITRTYSASMRTPRQQAVHDAVRSVQAEIIALLRPGLSVKTYLEQVDDIMKRHLIHLHLMKHQDDEANYRRYFPHSISHGLGIDVHDSLGRADTLQPGMVLTVEPGIYIPEEGIGVRIEDDILVTATGHENLSKKLAVD